MSDGRRLRTRTLELLRANGRVARRGGRRHRFSVPSQSAYPFQWFWDSCFHAIVWSHFDPERAADELRALLAWQRSDGFVPHVIFWDRRRSMRAPWHYFESSRWLAVPVLPIERGKPLTTELIQPPVLAIAVERVVQAGAGEQFAREALPALERYHRWLLHARDVDGDGLISIVAPSESGLDFSPAYDRALGLGRDPGLVPLTLAMRGATLRNKLRGWHNLPGARNGGFQVEDVLVNSCMVESLGALARLARPLGCPQVASWAEEQAERSLEALISSCYDPSTGRFRNLDGLEERPSEIDTIGSLVPLMVGALPASIAGRLAQRLRDRSTYRARYPVPSVAMNEPEFREDARLGGIDRIWRGTSWINTNWMIARGLRRHGFEDQAEEIRRASLDLVARHGFREYFNPLTGAPGGASGFGWSTLVIDL